MERHYQKLIVWQEAHKLCLFIYKITKTFPVEEKFCLVSQMRRSASSVPTNITEGNSRRSKKDRLHFFEIAQGSLEEIHYQCLLAKDLEYIDQLQFKQVDDSVQKIAFLFFKLRDSLS